MPIVYCNRIGANMTSINSYGFGHNRLLHAFARIKTGVDEMVGTTGGINRKVSAAHIASGVSKGFSQIDRCSK